MGDDVESQVRIGRAEAPARLLEDEGSLFQHELVEQTSVLDVVPAPVVGELEAGEVIGTVVDGAVVDRVVAIAAGPEGQEDMKVGLELKWQTGYLDTSSDWLPAARGG